MHFLVSISLCVLAFVLLLYSTFTHWFFSFGKLMIAAAAAAKSLQSCPTLCDPMDCSPPGSPVPGILRARTLEWVAISFSDAWKWSCPVVSDPQRPHGLQPSRLLCPWDFPGKSTGVGCHCLLLMTLLISWWLLLINSVLNNPVGFLYLSFNSLEFSPENNNNFTFFFLVFIFFSFSVSNLSSLIPSDQC